MKTGFDQSEEIARRVSKKLGCPAENLFVRVTESEEQKNLGGHERKANARDSILLRKSRFRRGSKVLLIDDILTTGATVSSCAGLLVEAGASKVFPAVLSRALTKEKR
jgi:competence protein ComFC